MRVYLKKKNNYIVLKLIVIVIIGIFCSLYMIKVFSKRIAPIYLRNAENEVRKLVINVVNSSINEEILNQIDDDELFNVVKNNNGEIVLIDYNSKYVNNYLTLVVKTVQKNLTLIENGKFDELEFSNPVLEDYDERLLKQGIIFEIPFGSFSGSNLLSNVGPNIPVRFNLIRNTSGGIDTKISEYGINNAFMEVSVKVNVNVNINLLFLSQDVSISCSVPISMKVIQGNIPNFYTGGLQSSFGY